MSIARPDDAETRDDSFDEVECDNLGISNNESTIIENINDTINLSVDAIKTRLRTA